MNKEYNILIKSHELSYSKPYEKLSRCYFLWLQNNWLGNLILFVNFLCGNFVRIKLDCILLQSLYKGIDLSVQFKSQSYYKYEIRAFKICLNLFEKKRKDKEL